MHFFKDPLAFWLSIHLLLFFFFLSFIGESLWKMKTGFEFKIKTNGKKEIKKEHSAIVSPTKNKAKESPLRGWAAATDQLESPLLSLSYPPIRSVHHVTARPITLCWQLRDSQRPWEIYRCSQSQPAPVDPPPSEASLSEPEMASVPGGHRGNGIHQTLSFCGCLKPYRATSGSHKPAHPEDWIPRHGFVVIMAAFTIPFVDEENRVTL